MTWLRWRSLRDNSLDRIAIPILRCLTFLCYSGHRWSESPRAFRAFWESWCSKRHVPPVDTALGAVNRHPEGFLDGTLFRGSTGLGAFFYGDLLSQA